MIGKRYNMLASRQYERAVTLFDVDIMGNTMTTLEVKLNLPDSLAKEATRMGLLNPDRLQVMLREAVRSRHITTLAEARRKIAAAGVAPMTMEEIQAEIEADRAERRKPAPN